MNPILIYSLIFAYSVVSIAGNAMSIELVKTCIPKTNTSEHTSSSTDSSKPTTTITTTTSKSTNKSYGSKLAVFAIMLSVNILLCIFSGFMIYDSMSSYSIGMYS